MIIFMWYVDIVRNTDWVDSFKIKHENVTNLSYDLFISKLWRSLDEFNKNISKAKWLTDSFKWLFWADKDFWTKKEKNWNIILSKEDKYLQEVALPKINSVILEYAKQWKIEEQEFKEELTKISSDFIGFMEGKTPKSNPLADYYWWKNTKRRIDAAWL